MVAQEEGDIIGERAALEEAFDRWPDDPHLPTVREWLLGRLHPLDTGQRRALAELLPAAITHAPAAGWGRRLVTDLVNEVRRDWEVPSFMTSRGRFRDGDPVSRAEAKLFLGFWSAGEETIATALAEILHGGLLRPHHIADAAFALIELGSRDRASTILEASCARRPAESRLNRVRDLCRSAIRAAAGDLDGAESTFAACDPDAPDRAYNEARMFIVRSMIDAGKPDRALRFLERLGPQDSPAREQQAWAHLELGEPRRAAAVLEPLIARNDHKSGRNLANLLHGAVLLAGGREEAAMGVFALLDAAPWPRTWTLGSHYFLEALGGGSLQAYLAGAFAWEKLHLRRQARLLAKVQGRPIGSIPPGILEG